MLLYPALDLIDGACVRLSQGEFASKTIYERDPSAMLARFEAAGAVAAHVVDLDGAKDPGRRQLELLERLMRTSTLKIQVGGGVRSVADVERLLALGAERVVVGTIAAERPDIFGEM